MEEDLITSMRKTHQKTVSGILKNMHKHHEAVTLQNILAHDMLTNIRTAIRTRKGHEGWLRRTLLTSEVGMEKSKARERILEEITPYTESVYCVKCHKKVAPKQPTYTNIVVGAKGTRKAITGYCPYCRTRVFKFVKG